MPNDFLDKVADKKNREFVIGFRWPFSVDLVQPGSEAEQMGLEVGDRFVAINQEPVKYFDDFSERLQELKDKSAVFTIERDGQTFEREANVPADGVLGFRPDQDLELVRQQFGFFEAVGEGTYNAFAVVWLNIKGFKKMIAGDVDVRKSLSGPIRIATFFGGTWDWNNFWRIVGLLSMVLAFMNFLPIPALDGGHVMFLTWEIVTGRKPSDRFLENAQKVGMVILLSLMAFVIINDTISLF